MRNEVDHISPKLRWALAQIHDGRAYTVAQSAVEVLIDLGLVERHGGFFFRATEEGVRALAEFNKYGDRVRSENKD